MHTWKIAAVIAVVGSVGCGTSEAPIGDDPLTSLEAELQDGGAFELESRFGESSDAQFVAEGVWVAEATPFPMDIEGGSAFVSYEDGALVVEELTVSFVGIDYEIPTGDQLDAMEIELLEPTRLSISESAEQIVADGTIDVRLAWWVETESSTIELQEQIVTGLPIALTVLDTEDGLELEAQLHKDHDVLAVDGVIDVHSFFATVAGQSPR